MPFRNLDLEISYDSDETDILESFYKPVLQESTLYQRLAGYFSSTTFGLVMREVVDFIESGGRIRLVTGAELAEDDVDIIEEYVSGQTEKFDEHLVNKIDTTDPLLSDCSALMGWMLVNKIDGEAQLEIKIAIPKAEEGMSSGLYHQKTGIFFDADGDAVSFEGSVNETGKAWEDNIESFKVSISWGDETDKKRIDDDRRKFTKFWTNMAKRTLVVDLPTAVKDKLLKMRPKSSADFHTILGRVRRSFSQIGDNSLLKRQMTVTGSAILLRDYQTDAIRKWSDNEFRGILEMATGTGKTFAALGCINRLTRITSRLVVVIACPYTHLVDQWRDSFDEYNLRIEKSWRNDDFEQQICYARYPNWKKKLKNHIKNFNESDVDDKHFLDRLVIFTTHDTMTSKHFIDLMDNVAGPTLLVADEMHALGSKSRFKNLMEYRYRLGLSATPDRYFDDEGTENLKRYFGGTVKKFPINRAIEENILSSYRYIPHIVNLSDDEMARYAILTRKIAKKLAVKDNSKSEEEELNSFIEGKRASIIAAAEEKYATFNTVLDQLGTLSQCLIYCHEKQLERVKNILFKKDVIYHQITFRESADERSAILEKLVQKKYDAVVAVRCLDEGVDVPLAKTGIILASTGNPRQYIQRRGRLLRKAEGKAEAIIHDILVAPYTTAPEREPYPFEKKIIQKELKRYSDFARFATNWEEAEKRIKHVRDAYGL